MMLDGRQSYTGRVSAFSLIQHQGQKGPQPTAEEAHLAVVQWHVHLHPPDETAAAVLAKPEASREMGCPIGPVAQCSMPTMARLLPLCLLAIAHLCSLHHSEHFTHQRLLFEF